MRTFPGIRFVFLDRDGVINRKPPEGEYIARKEDFLLLEGVGEAISQLNRSDRRVIVLTNQRGIALGKLTQPQLESVHATLRSELARFGAHIDALFHCPHDRGECDCRKPGIGMVEEAFRRYPDASAANSVMIGDSLSDVELAKRVGMASIFIEGDPEVRKPGAERAMKLADAVQVSLVEAVGLLRD